MRIMPFLLFLLIFCLSGLVFAQEQSEVKTPSVVSDNPYFMVPYSIDPSFSVSINYDFSIYDLIPDYIKRLEPCKDNVECVGKNLLDFETEKPEFKWLASYGGNVIGADKDFSKQVLWEVFCEDPKQHAVNSIAEAIDSCVGTTDTNCICNYSVPVGIRKGVEKSTLDSVFSVAKIINPAVLLLGITYDYVSKYGQPWTERTIEFISSGKDLSISLLPAGSAQPQIVHNVNSFGLGGVFSSPPAIVKVKFKNENPLAYRFNRENKIWEYEKTLSWSPVSEMKDSNGVWQAIIAKILSPPKTEAEGYAILKRYSDPNLESLLGIPGAGLGSNVKSQDKLKYSYADDNVYLDIHKDKNNNIVIYPQGKAPMQRQCKRYNKVMKFCIIQDKSVMAYNKDTNIVELQQLVMRFAYMFKGEVTSISNFEVYDLPLSSNQSFLVWDNMDGAKSYSIYYSENPEALGLLKDSPPKTLDYASIPDLKRLTIDISTAEDRDIEKSSILEPKCILDGFTCPIAYLVQSSLNVDDVALDDGSFTTVLKPNQLYYSVFENIYFYVIPELKNGQYYIFAITATDSTGAESPSFTVADSSEESAKDDLPTGIAEIVSAGVQDTDVVIEIKPLNYNLDGSEMEKEISDNLQYKIYCFDSAAVDFDISVKKEDGLSVWASPATSSGTGNTVIRAPVADFSTDLCGSTESIDSVRSVKFVVVGVKKIGIDDVDYAGIVSEKALSLPVILPTP